MFKHEEQAYVKEHIYIKLGADVTSQYVDTAEMNSKKIEEHFRHQLDEDKAGEQTDDG